MDTKKLIQELNVIFKQRGWELLPEDTNNVHKINNPSSSFVIVTLKSILQLLREYIPYDNHKDKFTTNELDDYVMEYIKPICKKYKIEEVMFFYGVIDRDLDMNRIEIK